MTESKKANYIASGNLKVDWVYHNLEWIIVALAGTLVFIVFEMQVYRIPTGSMAETLRGSHFRLRCEQCGYRYDYDFIPRHYKLPDTYLPKQDMPVIPIQPRCPSCGYYEDTGRFNQPDQKFYRMQDGKPTEVLKRPASRGDQIFVLKCIYQFFEPKRWDVVVFKNPVAPEINYIKRLIGLPGESVEIVDGDVYINDKIARKPAKVQDELWMCLYDNDYRPARPDEPRFNGHKWEQPFETGEQSAWNLMEDGGAVFSLLTSAGQTPQYVQYNPVKGNDFRATYAYDDSASYTRMPVCSDLMLRYYVQIGADSAAGVQLGKYGVIYEGWVDCQQTMKICRIDNGQQQLLVEGKCRKEDIAGLALLRFSNTDHLLTLEMGQSRIEYDLGANKNDAGTERHKLPTAAIAGYGQLKLWHVKLMRDIHYIDGPNISEPVYLANPKAYEGYPMIRRAFEDHPLALQIDEFFVCGDNSPFSLDARLWNSPAKSNPGKSYREGIVPRDYMVGKAFFVHFPGNWRFDKEGFRKIPYLDGPPEPDGVKIIYGGK